MNTQSTREQLSSARRLTTSLSGKPLNEQDEIVARAIADQHITLRAQLAEMTTRAENAEANHTFEQQAMQMDANHPVEMMQQVWVASSNLQTELTEMAARVDTLDTLTTMQDGGIRDLHTQIKQLRAQLAEMEHERDRWFRKAIDRSSKHDPRA